MKVLERYGYKDKDNISDTTTFQADPNQYIYASMTGKVSIDGNDVSIEQGRKRITYYDLQNIRVTAGEQTLRNEIIGQVKQEGKQAVKYEKLKFDLIDYGIFLTITMDTKCYKQCVFNKAPKMLNLREKKL